MDAPVYFVHQSTAEAVGLVAAARRRGVRAYGETVAHRLVLDDSAYRGGAPNASCAARPCAPPTR